MRDLLSLSSFSALMHLGFGRSSAALAKAFCNAFLFPLTIVSAIRPKSRGNRGRRKRKSESRSERKAVPVDTRAIVGIWEKASAEKMTRLHGRQTDGVTSHRTGMPE